MPLQLARRARLRLEPLDDRWLLTATGPFPTPPAPAAPAVVSTTQAPSPTFDLVLAEFPADQAAGRTVLIDWGDGTRSAASVQSAGADRVTVRAARSFPGPGTYSVTLTLTPAEGDGRAHVFRLSITVRTLAVPSQPVVPPLAGATGGGGGGGASPPSGTQGSGDTIIFICEVRRLGDSVADSAPFRGRQDYGPVRQTPPADPRPGPAPPISPDARTLRSAPLRALPTRPGPASPAPPDDPESGGPPLGTPVLAGANGSPALAAPAGLGARSAPGARPVTPASSATPAGDILGPAWSSSGVLRADGAVIVAAELEQPTEGQWPGDGASPADQTTPDLAERCDALVRRLAAEPLPEEQAGLPRQAPPPDAAAPDESRRLWPIWLAALGLVGWSARTLVGPRRGGRQTGPTGGVRNERQVSFIPHSSLRTPH
jgi:hypothetical protein